MNYVFFIFVFILKYFQNVVIVLNSKGVKEYCWVEFLLSDV